MAEPLGVLLLPSRLEDFAFADHARELLAIPRVVALEARRGPISGILADIVTTRQARRLKLPGTPRLLVLYDPRQYALARALRARHPEVELWYVRPTPRAEPPADERRAEEIATLDGLARDAAQHMLLITDSPQPLRQRMVELEIISSRPFVPGARVEPR